MEWLTTLKETLHYIEANLTAELTLEQIAQRVYLSPFYLQKGFQLLTGYSLGEYIRCRRLYEAARALVNTEDKVIDIAYRYGYETPESFTKAFTRFHGASPMAVRKDRKRIRRFLPLQISIAITGGDKLDYKIEKMTGFTVIGFERVFGYEKPYEEIPKFWDELYAKYPVLKTGTPDESDPVQKAIRENRIGEYAVCIDDLGDGCFRYLVAGAFRGGEAPEGLSTFTFPDMDWAKFRSVGPIPDALQSLNTQVFKEWLPGNQDYLLAGPYNIEWYGMGDPSAPDYECGIWLPVIPAKAEAAQHWGDTEAFKESEKRTTSRTQAENAAVNDGLMAVIARFGELTDKDPASEAAQKLASELQAYITKHYYPCTDVIFAGLGEMYVSDERFRANIDRAGGSGTAALASEAIRIFCEKRKK